MSCVFVCLLTDICDGQVIFHDEGGCFLAFRGGVVDDLISQAVRFPNDGRRWEVAHFPECNVAKK